MVPTIHDLTTQSIRTQSGEVGAKVSVSTWSARVYLPTRRKESRHVREICCVGYCVLMNEEPVGYNIYMERRSCVAYRNSARLISSINQYQAFLVWADILNQSVSGLPSVG